MNTITICHSFTYNEEFEEQWRCDNPCILALLVGELDNITKS